MAVCRIQKTKDYTIMANHHFKNTNLSLKAVGLLSKILSLPEDWNYTVSGLCSICKESESAIKSALKELKSEGYLEVLKINPSKETGGHITYEYVFYEVPNQGGGFLPLENQPLEVQPLENHPTILNTNKSNTNKSNTNKSIYIAPTSIEVAEPASESFPELNIPLNDGSVYEVLVDDFYSWTALYPAVDIKREIARMNEWIKSNPKKKKTRSGIRRFIQTWLDREQNRGGNIKSNQPQKMDRFVAYAMELERQENEEKRNSENSGFDVQLLPYNQR